jgi:hypothetical protein
VEYLTRLTHLGALSYIKPEAPLLQKNVVLIGNLRRNVKVLDLHMIIDEETTKD